jgi:hypothetical protein
LAGVNNTLSTLTFLEGINKATLIFIIKKTFIHLALLVRFLYLEGSSAVPKDKTA